MWPQMQCVRVLVLTLYACAWQTACMQPGPCFDFAYTSTHTHIHAPSRLRRIVDARRFDTRTCRWNCAFERFFKHALVNVWAGDYSCVCNQDTCTESEAPICGCFLSLRHNHMEQTNMHACALNIKAHQQEHWFIADSTICSSWPCMHVWQR